jgi:phosphatidylethanolamine-binding protein (PEBP) family uncharacterized protein
VVGPSRRDSLAGGQHRRQGRNDFGAVGYRGPCPPHGQGRHRYRFRLHDVTGDLGLAPGAGVQELERAVAAKVLAVAELVGTYQRRLGSLRVSRPRT